VHAELLNAESGGYLEAEVHAPLGAGPESEHLVYDVNPCCVFGFC